MQAKSNVLGDTRGLDKQLLLQTKYMGRPRVDGIIWGFVAGLGR